MQCYRNKPRQHEKEEKKKKKAKDRIESYFRKRIILHYFSHQFWLVFISISSRLVETWPIPSLWDATKQSFLTTLRYSHAYLKAEALGLFLWLCRSAMPLLRPHLLGRGVGGIQLPFVFKINILIHHLNAHIINSYAPAFANLLLSTLELTHSTTRSPWRERMRPTLPKEMKQPFSSALKSKFLPGSPHRRIPNMWFSRDERVQIQLYAGLRLPCHFFSSSRLGCWQLSILCSVSHHPQSEFWLLRPAQAMHLIQHKWL